MPIRFRCVYCNQKMGIARRKAGSVVSCPKCAGQLVVPQPAEDDPADSDREPEPAGAVVGPAAHDLTASPNLPARPAANGPPRPDSKNLPATAPARTEAAPTPPPRPAPGPSLFERADIDEILAGEAWSRPEPALPPPAPRPLNPIDRAAHEEARRVASPPVPATVPAPAAGLLLTPTVATVLSVAVVLALAFAFAAGLVVGLALRPTPG
jgi:hypothetical protein